VIPAVEIPLENVFTPAAVCVVERSRKFCVVDPVPPLVIGSAFVNDAEGAKNAPVVPLIVSKQDDVQS
jgi:hypothetical protein